MVDADKAVVDNKLKVTEDQLRAFLGVCWTKYVKAKIEPGKLWYMTGTKADTD